MPEYRDCNERNEGKALAGDLLTLAEALDRGSLDCVDLLRSKLLLEADDLLAVSGAVAALDRAALMATRLAALLAPQYTDDWRQRRKRPFDPLAPAKDAG